MLAVNPRATWSWPQKSGTNREEPQKEISEKVVASNGGALSSEEKIKTHSSSNLNHSSRKSRRRKASSPSSVVVVVNGTKDDTKIKQPIEDDLTLSPSSPFARSQVMFFERLKPQSQAAGVSGEGGGPSPASKVRKLHENGQDHQQDILSNGSLMVDGSSNRKGRNRKTKGNNKKKKKRWSFGQTCISPPSPKPSESQSGATPAVLVDNPLMHIIEAERRRQQLEEEEAAAAAAAAVAAERSKKTLLAKFQQLLHFKEEDSCPETGEKTKCPDKTSGGGETGGGGAFKRKSPWYSSFGSRQFGKKPKLNQQEAVDSKPTSSNEKTDDENVRKASDELSRMALGKSLRIEDPNEADTVEEGRDELMEEDETDTVVVKKRNKCFLQSPRIGSDVSQDSGLGEEVLNHSTSFSTPGVAVGGIHKNDVTAGGRDVINGHLSHQRHASSESAATGADVSTIASNCTASALHPLSKSSSGSSAGTGTATLVPSTSQTPNLLGSSPISPGVPLATSTMKKPKLSITFNTDCSASDSRSISLSPRLFSSGGSIQSSRNSSHGGGTARVVRARLLKTRNQHLNGSSSRHGHHNNQQASHYSISPGSPQQQAGVATTPTLLKAPRTPPHTTMMSVSSQWEQLCHEAEAAVVRKLREQKTIFDCDITSNAPSIMMQADRRVIRLMFRADTSRRRHLTLEQLSHSAGDVGHLMDTVYRVLFVEWVGLPYDSIIVHCSQKFLVDVVDVCCVELDVVERLRLAKEFKCLLVSSESEGYRDLKSTLKKTQVMYIQLWCALLCVPFQNKPTTSGGQGRKHRPPAPAATTIRMTS